jgi:hypothetical protein
MPKATDTLLGQGIARAVIYAEGGLEAAMGRCSRRGIGSGSGSTYSDLGT